MELLSSMLGKKAFDQTSLVHLIVVQEGCLKRPSSPRSSLLNTRLSLNRMIIESNPR